MGWILNFIPSERINDVIYFNPADVDFPTSLNILEKVEPERRHLAVYGLISVLDNSMLNTGSTYSWL